MVSQPSPYVLTMPSDLGLVSSARGFITAVCIGRGFDTSSIEALALAVHEALTNIIRHAHQHRSEVPLEIRCYPQDDHMEIHILDEGEPFDLDAIPYLDPSELRIGGRGVFLMRMLTDELSCRPRPERERGNVLRMVKRCGKDKNDKK